MIALSTMLKPRPSLSRNFACTAATLAGLLCATSLHAQTPSAAPPPTAADQQVLPTIGSPSGFTGTTAAPAGVQPDASPYAHTDTQHDSGSPHHSRSAADAPFKIPHSVTKTTASGVKFQFTAPRVGFRAGDAQMGHVSPLDSNGPQFASSRSNPIFPADDNFLQPTDTGSDNMFGSSNDGLADMPTGGHRGAGGAGRGGAGGPGLNVKSSTFDFHVGLSMKDMMAGSFSQGGSQNGGGNASSGFSMSGSSANDFSTPGGIHTPGAEGRGGSGAKLSLGLRF